MPSTESNTASTTLNTVAADPAEMSGDAGSVKNHNLKDLIEHDRYMLAKDASASARRGLRITRLIPPGTTD
jgi:hypothetical protein